MAKMLHASAGCDMVKLETMTSIMSIPWSESRTGFPVLVRVTAPLQRTQRHSLDLVAVLDTSGSMNYEGRLDCVKKAMMFVIDNLGDDDRLSIVPFSQTNNDHLRCPLSLMSRDNRNNLKTIVDKLQAGGGDDLEAANEAAQILRERAQEESSSRIGRIIYLSDGSYTVEDVSPEFPANTFGLGSGHRPETMQYISNKTSGVYSYVNKNLDKIKDAFAQSIGGLTSVTSIDLKIELKTHEGVSISSIESGIYQHSISSGDKVGTIHINDLCAGETKNFIVYLTIPGCKDKLMTVSGSYKNLKISKNDIHLGESKVVVKRPRAWPWASTGSNEVVHPEVAAELARLQLVKGVSDMANKNQYNKKNLQRLWHSVNGLNAPDQKMSDDEVKPFMLSWLTSHLSQRATTKGSPSESGDFQTIAMKNMVRVADKRKPEKEVEPQSSPPLLELELSDKLKAMWQKGITWAKSNPWFCALPFVTLLLLAALLLIMRVGTTTTEKTIIIIEDKIDNSSSPLDVSNHQGWPKMEKAFEVTMLRSMEDAGIAPLLNGASVEEMRHATIRYLYLAIVHASVLGSRCSSKDVATISELEEKVRSLEAEKKLLLAQIEALAKEKEELAVSAAKCVTGKENDEALQRGNTRIAELEKQLQDKKAFADSLLSEVTNADVHLKTCGQRVDMLEAKVREMEGVVISQ